MKKLIAVFAVLMLLCSGVYAKRTLELTADTLVKTGIGQLRGIFVITDGTNDVTVDIYDNTTTLAGKEMIPSWTINGADTYGVLSFDHAPEGFGTGLYIDVTTVGTVTFMVYYD